MSYKVVREISINGRRYQAGDVVSLADKTIEMDLLAAGILVDETKTGQKAQKAGRSK